MAESRRIARSQDSGRVLAEHLGLGVTGCLALRTPDGSELRIYLMQGEILAAHGPDDGPWIVRRLVNNGALTESQGEYYLRRLAGGDRLDELMFGQVPDELLLDMMAARFRQNVLTFVSVSGSLSFEAMDAIFVDNIQVGHDSHALLDESVRLRDRVRILRQRAGAITIRPGHGRVQRAEEARLLDLCEVPQRLSDLVVASPYEEGLTLDLVHGLLSTGVLLAEGVFPVDDDEPTESAVDEEDIEDVPSAMVEPLDAWTEDASPLETAPPAAPAQGELEGETVPMPPQAPIEEESLGPVVEIDEGQDAGAADTEARHEAEQALRRQIEAELAGAAGDTGASQPSPPGFDYAAQGADVELALFEDVDRNLGRGGGEGAYTSEIRDRVELIPELPEPEPSEEMIEAGDDSALSAAERKKVRSLAFSAPVLDEDDARHTLDVVNGALREISRVLDDVNGPGAGHSFVQVLIEGTPAEFSVLFRAVDARRDGCLPVEGVLRNLRERPRTEHRQLVQRGVEDLIDRALTLSCEDLDDETADRLAERVLGYRKQLSL